MHTLLKKIRLIYIPYLLVSGIFIALYSWLHWYFFIKAEYFKLDEDILNLYLPMAVPIIPVLLIFPRFRLLNKGKDKSASNQFIIAVSWVTVTMCLIVSQPYLQTSTGKLTHLDNISQINTLPKTKFYTLKHTITDKEHIGWYGKTHFIGFKTTSLYYELFYIVRILDSAADTSKHDCHAFMGIKYQQYVDKSLSKKEKDKIWGLFADHCDSDFAAKDLSKFEYLDRIGTTDDHTDYLEALKKISNADNIKDPPILVPMYSPYKEKNGDKSPALLILVFCMGGFIMFIIIFATPFDEEKLKTFEGRSTGAA